MFDLCAPPEEDEGEGPMVARLRAIIVSTAKETAFKKVRNYSVPSLLITEYLPHTQRMYSNQVRNLQSNENYLCS